MKHRTAGENNLLVFSRVSVCNQWLLLSFNLQFLCFICTWTVFFVLFFFREHLRIFFNACVYFVHLVILAVFYVLF